MSLGKKINIQLLLLFWPLAELALLCLFLFLSFDFYYSWGKPYSFSIPPEQYFNILLALPLYALAHFFIFYDWKAKKMRSLFLQRAEPALALGLRSLGAFSLFTLIISLIAVYRGQALSLGVILIFLCILSIIFFYEEIYKYLSSHCKSSISGWGPFTEWLESAYTRKIREGPSHFLSSYFTFKLEA